MMMMMMIIIVIIIILTTISLLLSFLSSYIPSCLNLGCALYAATVAVTVIQRQPNRLQKLCSIFQRRCRVSKYIGHISSSTNPLNAREYSQIATNYRHFNCTVPLGPPGKYEEIIVATPVFLHSNEHIFFDRQLHIHSIPSSKDIERQRVLCTVPCRHALDYFDSSHSLQQVPQ